MCRPGTVCWPSLPLSFNSGALPESGLLAASAGLGSPSVELLLLLELAPADGAGAGVAPDSPGNGNFLPGGTPGADAAGGGSVARGAPLTGAEFGVGALVSPGNGNFWAGAFLSLCAGFADGWPGVWARPAAETANASSTPAFTWRNILSQFRRSLRAGVAIMLSTTTPVIMSGECFRDL